VRASGLYLLSRQHLPTERAAEAMGDLLGVDCSTVMAPEVFGHPFRSNPDTCSGVFGHLARRLS